jgi:hypothetical protein
MKTIARLARRSDHEAVTMIRTSRETARQGAAIGAVIDLIVLGGDRESVTTTRMDLPNGLRPIVLGTMIDRLFVWETPTRGGIATADGRPIGTRTNGDLGNRHAVSTIDRAIALGIPGAIWTLTMTKRGAAIAGVLTERTASGCHRIVIELMTEIPQNLMIIIGIAGIVLVLVQGGPATVDANAILSFNSGDRSLDRELNGSEMPLKPTSVYSV